MTIVHFRLDGVERVLDVKMDPFAVCDLALKRIFPNAQPRADLVFQRIMQERKRRRDEQ